MNNCFSNNYLWILIILAICFCQNGSICGILDKLTDCSCLIPLALVYFCCCSNKNKGLNFGCGCK